MNEACNKHREAPIVGRFECGSCALEKVRSERYELAAENDRLRAELAALKAGQGEAVAWMVISPSGYPEKCTASDPEGFPVYRAAPPASADAVSVPIDFVRFLLGEADLNGYSFGDMHQVRVGKFWWRTELRALLAQSQEAKP